MLSTYFHPWIPPLRGCLLYPFGIPYLCIYQQDCPNKNRSAALSWRLLETLQLATKCKEIQRIRTDSREQASDSKIPARTNLRWLFHTVFTDGVTRCCKLSNSLCTFKKTQNISVSFFLFGKLRWLRLRRPASCRKPWGPVCSRKVGDPVGMEGILPVEHPSLDRAPLRKTTNAGQRDFMVVASRLF